MSILFCYNIRCSVNQFFDLAQYLAGLILSERHKLTVCFHDVIL